MVFDRRVPCRAACRFFFLRSLLTRRVKCQAKDTPQKQDDKHSEGYNGLGYTPHRIFDRDLRPANATFGRSFLKICRRTFLSKVVRGAAFFRSVISRFWRCFFCLGSSIFSQAFALILRWLFCWRRACFLLCPSSAFGLGELQKLLRRCLLSLQTQGLSVRPTNHSRFPQILLEGRDLLCDRAGGSQQAGHMCR